MKYFGCFQIIGSRHDRIIDVVADNDCEALAEYRRIWTLIKMSSNVTNGYLFEIHGRLLLRTTTLHQLIND